VDRAGQWGRSPQQSAFAVGEDLDIHAVAFPLSRIVGPFDGEAVGRDQRAVQNRVQQLGGLVDDPVQAGCDSGEQVESFVDVALGGRDADAESVDQPGVGVAVTQVREHQ
jgi:hypothetical protein